MPLFQNCCLSRLPVQKRWITKPTENCCLSKWIVQKRWITKPTEYTTELSPLIPSDKSIPTYRILDNDGALIDPNQDPKVKHALEYIVTVD